MVYKCVWLSLATATLLGASETMVLDEITTLSTATKSEKNIEGVSASVVVIDEKEITKMGAESLKDILSQTSGVTLQYGTFSSASSISKSSIVVRGMGSKGTLLLIDGRRISGEVANPYDLERLPASQIERIDIVKGPMSTLYGADAMGGVVNIITKKSKEEPQVDVGVRYGANGHGEDENKNANIAIRGKVDHVGYSFYANETHTTPYTQREVSDVWARTSTGKSKPSAYPAGQNATLSSTLQNSYATDVTYRDESDVSTQGGRITYDISDAVVAGIEFNHFTEERYGTYIGYFHPANYNLGASTNKIAAYNVPVNSKDENERLDVGVDLKIKATDTLNVMLRAYNSSYEKRSTITAKYWADMGYTSEAASAQNGMDANVDTTTYEVSANYLIHEDHLLTFGIERRFEEREASVFTLANTMSTKKVDYAAGYVQDEWQATKDLSITLGGRFDEISNADSKATFKIGAVNRFDEALQVRANFAQGYRTPDIRELYIYKNTASGLQRGALVIDASVGKTNAYDLKPEFLNSYEIGSSGKVGVGKYDVAFFYNDIEDKISEVNTGSYYTFINIPKATTYGMEASWLQPLFERVDLALSWTELRSENKESEKDLEFTPERTVGAKLSYAVNRALVTSLGVQYTGEQYYLKTVNRGAPTQSLVDATADDYVSVNWGVNYALTKTVTLYGGINNLTNEGVDDVLGSSSGRYFFMGAKAHL